MTIIMLIAL